MTRWGTLYFDNTLKPQQSAMDDVRGWGTLYFDNTLKLAIFLGLLRP